MTRARTPCCARNAGHAVTGWRGYFTEAAPDDMLVLVNLGRTAREVGDTARAREAFKTVAQKSKDPQLRRDAKAELKKLGRP